MSGTTIPYGDRPMARVGPGDGVYATFEFLQYLERLSRAHNSNTAAGADVAAQVDTNTTAIATLNGEVSTLTTQASTAASNDTSMQGQINSIRAHSPSQVELDQAGAIALTSGTPIQLTSLFVAPNLSILVGTVYFTGTGSVTLARGSVGVTTAVIETLPGAFATGWFGGGASPGSLGADLSVGSFVRCLHIIVPTTLYLNVEATFTGAISAYGSLIVWPLGG